MLLGEMLVDSAQRFSDRVALRCDDQFWSYTALNETVDRIASGLRTAGVGPGDRVALFMPNCAELLFSYFACFKLGAVAVPLNYRYRQAEAEYALTHSGAKALIVHHSLTGEVENLPLAEMGILSRYVVGQENRAGFGNFKELLAAQPDQSFAPSFPGQQPAAILYTSGTTAKPKGVTYTHETLWHNCRIQVETFAFTPEDVHLVTTAACHAAAFTGQLLPGIYSGGTSVLTHLPKSNEIIRLIAAHGVTRTQMLPAMLEDLVEQLERLPRTDLKSWRCATAGGDVVPLELHNRFREATGFDITELYGMTEALSCITNPPFGDKRLGSIGKPAAQTQVRLVDAQDRDVPAGQTGELLIKSPAVMVGYWNDSQATQAALRGGWMHTGDLARCDEDGFYWFVSRRKEIIIRGGSNIAPLEVEEAIDAHPAVRLSCVLGKPDRHLGETVMAYVALRPDAEQRPTVEELRQFVACRIAAYKVPETIVLVDDLPLSPTGKVDRKRLHAELKSTAR